MQDLKMTDQIAGLEDARPDPSYQRGSIASSVAALRCGKAVQMHYQFVAMHYQLHCLYFRMG